MVEVLAPAGNIDALKSAVNNCADAVYLGLEQFNARLKADNFSTQNIGEWVDFCHLYGVKVYVTINTSLKQKELKYLDNILISCEKAKVDALIVTDLAVAKHAKELCPSVALHASTQLGVHNRYGAKFLENLGFSRVVLSRECKIADIKDIKQNTNLEIEYFVHGAMCVSFSGGCLLSSISNGNSGNRGLCLQPCRKLYTESLKNTSGYLISPKDQCLINDIQALVDAGVDSLKIEGRLKSAQYVGVTVSKYRKAVDKLPINDADISEMKRMFNRGGFSRGYAFSNKNQILYMRTQNNIGECVGEVTNCVKAKDYFKIEIKSDFSFINGDGVKIFENNAEKGGFEISIIEQKGNSYKVYSKSPYNVGSKVHITTDKQLIEKSDSVVRKILIAIDVCVKNSIINFKAQYKNNFIEYDFDCELQAAINVATPMQEIKTQLSKTGNTEFEFSKINIDLKENLFIPKSILNKARREWIEFLKTQIIKINTPKLIDKSCKINAETDKFYLDNCNNFDCEFKDIVVCGVFDLSKIKTPEKYNFVIDFNDFDNFIMKNGLIESNLYIKLPKIAMFSDLKVVLDKLETLPNCVGIYADNVYAVQIAKEQNRKVIGGLGLNIFNSEHAKMLGVKNFVASCELNKDEICELGGDCAIYAFGYLPVMTFCHCPIQHFTGCDCSNCKYKDYDLSDNFGKFEVRRNKIVNCYFEMYNSSLHFVENELLPNNCKSLIDLTLFKNNDDFACKILNNSCNILDKGIKLTRGQFLRGVK